MKRCLLVLLLLFSSRLFAQISYTDSTQIKIADLTDRVEYLEADNQDLNKIVEVQKKLIAGLDSQLTVTQANIKHIADSLNITLTKVSTTNKLTQNQITGLNQTLSKSSLYWIIGISAVALLCLIIFLFLRKKLSASTRHLDSQISKTNENLQNETQKVDSKIGEIERSNVSLHYEAVMLDSKLGEIAKNNETIQAEGVKKDTEIVAILLSQLAVLKKERESKESSKEKPDHKAFKKAGDEIYSLRKRTDTLPKKIKGLTALKNSLQKLEEEFTESGYVIEDLFGKSYTPDLKVDAKFIENADTTIGDEIITEVFRPQILYKGKVIQTAKVEVSRHSLPPEAPVVAVAVAPEPSVTPEASSTPEPSANPEASVAPEPPAAPESTGEEKTT